MRNNAPPTAEEWGAHIAFYRLTVSQRDAAWAEVERLRKWLEHIERETPDEEDGGAFARDMARRALADK